MSFIPIFLDLATASSRVKDHQSGPTHVGLDSDVFFCQTSHFSLSTDAFAAVAAVHVGYPNYRFQPDSSHPRYIVI